MLNNVLIIIIFVIIGLVGIYYINSSQQLMMQHSENIKQLVDQPKVAYVMDGWRVPWYRRIYHSSRRRRRHRRH